MKNESLHNMKRLMSFNTIRRILPLGGFGILFLFAFVACTSDEDGNSDNRLPITFSCSEDGVTRAEVSLSEFISDFKVYGINGDISGSGNAATFTKKNTVFPDYQVWHTENLANTTSTNTANWEYVGIVEGASGSEEQTIKYWDEKRDGHYFWAIGDFSKSGGYDYTESTYVPKSKYGQPVTLTFLRYCSRIRIGFYEDITQSGGDKRYKVVGVDFYRVNDDGTFNTNELPTTNVSLRGNFVNEGKVWLTYTNASFKGGDNIDNVTTETVPVENGTSKYMDFGVLNIAGTQSGALPTSSSEALFTTNNGSQYTKVLPYNNTEGLTLQCDILVRNQNESQFTQQNVLASIPAHYTNWQPNQSYTYIFKIVTTPDGAAIILANVEVESWKSDGLIEDEWHNW